MDGDISMKIKINKQNDMVIINETLTLPMDGKIIIEFEKETLNSGAITGGKIGDIVGDVAYDNFPPNAIPCTTTGELIGTFCDFNKKMNHEYVPKERLTKTEGATS